MFIVPFAFRHFELIFYFLKLTTNVICQPNPIEYNTKCTNWYPLSSQYINPHTLKILVGTKIIGEEVTGASL